MFFKILKLMLNRDSKIVICSRFVNCELWSCDMNSTLGSVVPLAMFVVLPEEGTFHRLIFHAARRTNSDSIAMLPDICIAPFRKSCLLQMAVYAHCRSLSDRSFLSCKRTHFVFKSNTVIQLLILGRHPNILQWRRLKSCFFSGMISRKM